MTHLISLYLYSALQTQPQMLVLKTSNSYATELQKNYYIFYFSIFSKSKVCLV